MENRQPRQPVSLREDESQHGFHGRGGPWSERWKAWIRCFEHANYKHGSTPGDPLRYEGDDIQFVEDFVRSWGLVPEFYNFTDGRLHRQAGTCKG